MWFMEQKEEWLPYHMQTRVPSLALRQQVLTAVAQDVVQSVCGAHYGDIVPLKIALDGKDRNVKSFVP